MTVNLLQSDVNYRESFVTALVKNDLLIFCSNSNYKSKLFQVFKIIKNYSNHFQNSMIICPSKLQFSNNEKFTIPRFVYFKTSESIFRIFGFGNTFFQPFKFCVSGLGKISVFLKYVSKNAESVSNELLPEFLE